jgi:alanyl-tRNA synthetase
MSRSLKVPVAETGAGTLAILEKTKALEQRLKELEEGAAEIKARALLEKAGLDAGAGKTGSPDGKSAALIESYALEDMDEVLRIGKAAQKHTRAALVLASEKDRKFAALCSLKGADVRPLVKDAFEKAGGKGGGGPSFFQGLFNSAAELNSFIADVRAGAGSST